MQQPSPPSVGREDGATQGVHQEVVHPEHVHLRSVSLDGRMGMVFVGQHKLVPSPGCKQAALVSGCSAMQRG